ncbi:MAG: matrixin family metalloprotease [Dehalococcoidales bacterium]
MKKLLVALLVVALVVTSSVAVATAKPDKPTRPEKLDQVIFVHPVAPDKPGKPDKPPGKPPKDEEPQKDNTYFELWGGYLVDTAEYYINPNVILTTGGDPVAAVNNAADAWDVVTTDELFNYAGTTIKNWYAEDEENTVSWVKFIPRDYIAIAVMWYDQDMVIWEFDIVFNAFHNWGIDPVKRDRSFDIQNIATHEFGHPVGLDDLYDEIYSELTMYGYSKTGETQKRSLEEGDIAGAQSLYGAP